jgi:hypothetical protein
LPIDGFHFGVEPFGDSIVASESPHGGNLSGSWIRWLSTWLPEGQ